ncbi:hypothetical protein SMD44_00752 [Streptomyces alboflavus]|uniref:Peptidase M4 domain-containing protein n=1 Tax=Streptomyces alboflavus TaxID=67267 RepID=A0A1Z1W4M1_9ACTN|nr:hypothetical protein SMD44_00752 [Streptomyces alboflavus]
MDSGLISTVIATVGGGLLGGGGAVLSHRSNTRTAARLIYAELARNSAAVAYFRQTGHWTAPTLSRTAWDEQAAIIARRRGSAAFVAVHQGYEALEIAPVLAAGGLGDAARDRLLSGAVRQLVRALEEVAAMARIPPELVREATGLLDGSHPAPVEETGALTWLLQGVVPLALQARLAPQDVARLVTEPAPEPPTAAPAATEDADHVVYDAGHSRETTGLAVARRTGQPPTGDPVVDEAYDAMLATSAFARAVLGRDPLVRRPMTAVVHYGDGFTNLYWNGELLVLGDGDGQTFGRFSQCLDVVAGGIWMGVREMMGLFSHAGRAVRSRSRSATSSGSSSSSTPRASASRRRTGWSARACSHRASGASGCTPSKHPAPRTTTPPSARTRRRRPWTPTSARAATTAASTSTAASPGTRSTSSPSASAGTRGSAPG